MSMGPTWNQGAEPPPPPKSGSKAWLIIGIVLGLCVLLCCGGFIALSTWFGTQVAGMMSYDPAEVRKAQAEVVDIEIPAEVPPKFKFNLEFMGQKVALLVYYGAPGDDNLVWLAQAGNNLQMQTQNDPDQLRAQLETQLVAQAQTAQTGTFKSLTNTTQRDVEVTVNGKASKLTLTEGTDSAGKKLVQVEGMFDGKGGPTLIKMQLEADKFPPEKVEEMLQGMK